MARPNPIRTMMATPLPSKTVQRRLPYRPKLSEVIYTYNILNRYVFDNKLVRPTIVTKTLRKAWGVCYGLAELDYSTGSNCRIQINDKWFSTQWMVTTLAHEMCHQYQWDVLGPIREDEGKEWLMSHGPTFHEHKDRLAYYDVPLKVCHSKRLWFEHQDLFLA